MKQTHPMILAAISLALFTLTLPACDHLEEHVHAEHQHGHHKVVVTSPVQRDVVSTQEYVCQIHSCRHIEVCSLEGGYLEAVPVKEGQVVTENQPLFQIVPTLFQAKLDSEKAEAELAQVEFDNTRRLFEKNVVAAPELALAKAKLSKAEAQVKLAQAEMNFTQIKAPFSGIIDRLHHQQGSLIDEGEVLTTLSDNSVMWVYFNVPEARYLEYQKELGKINPHLKVELMLADGSMFPYEGTIAAIEADFDNETGNIPFRADFPNADGLLRHGQTGTIMISRVMEDAIVIPQRATYEVLAKKYVVVVDDVNENRAGHGEHGRRVGHHGEESAADAGAQHEEIAAHATEHTSVGHEADLKSTDEPSALHYGKAQQMEIKIVSEQEDIYILKHELRPDQKIVLEGVQQVRDGDEIEYEFRQPEEVFSNLKYHAE